jgi:hypothetical protein
MTRFMSRFGEAARSSPAKGRAAQGPHPAAHPEERLSPGEGASRRTRAMSFETPLRDGFASSAAPQDERGWAEPARIHRVRFEAPSLRGHLPPTRSPRGWVGRNASTRSVRAKSRTAVERSETLQTRSSPRLRSGAILDSARTERVETPSLPRHPFATCSRVGGCPDRIHPFGSSEVENRCRAQRDTADPEQPSASLGPRRRARTAMTTAHPEERLSPGEGASRRTRPNVPRNAASGRLRLLSGSSG